MKLAGWTVPDELWSVTALALEAHLVYEGPFPARSRDYYALTTTSVRHGYVYVLASDHPLYVGRSWRPGNRFDKHRRHKAWWPEVENLSILRVCGADRRETDALTDRLETYAIRRLCPTYNIAKAA